MKYSTRPDPFIRRISIAGITLVFLLLAIIILLAAQLDRLNHLTPVKVVIGDSTSVRKAFDQDSPLHRHLNY